MNAETFTLWFVVPLVFIAQAMFVAAVIPRGNQDGRAGGIERALAHLRHNPAGIAVIMLSWLLLTAVAWWYEFFIAFGVMHLALFLAGRVAAVATAALFAGLFLVTPVLIGRVILNMARRGAMVATPSRWAHA